MDGEERGGRAKVVVVGPMIHGSSSGSGSSSGGDGGSICSSSSHSSSNRSKSSRTFCFRYRGGGTGALSGTGVVPGGEAGVEGATTRLVV